MNSGQFDDSPSRPGEGETRNGADAREEQNLPVPASTATFDGRQSNEEDPLSVTKSIEVGSSNVNCENDEAKAESQEEHTIRVGGILAAESNKKKEKSGNNEAVAESGEPAGEQVTSAVAPVAQPVVSTEEDRPVEREVEKKVVSKTGSVEPIIEKVSNEAEEPPLSANKDEPEKQETKEKGDTNDAKVKIEESLNAQDSKPAAREAKEPPIPLDKDEPEEQKEGARIVAETLTRLNKKNKKKEVLTESGEPPGDNDILFGRGYRYYNHNNKTVWRKLIMSNYQIYGGIRIKKTREYASKFVDIIKSKGHRFLQEKDGIWKDAEHDHAVQKTMQALRDESLKRVAPKDVRQAFVQQAARRPGGPKTTGSSDDQEEVENPQEQDVLFGTGRAHYQHNSRTLWRQLILQRRPYYNSAQSRGAGVKRRIAQDIVDSAKQVGARFLEKGPDRRRWKQVTDEARVTEKTQNALRQKRKDDPDLGKEHEIMEEAPPPVPVRHIPPGVFPVAESRRRAPFQQQQQQRQQREEMKRQQQQQPPPIVPPVAYPHQYRPYPMGAFQQEARMPVPPAVGPPQGQQQKEPVPLGKMHPQQTPVPPYGYSYPFGYPMGQQYPPMTWQPPQGPQKANATNDAQQQEAQGDEQSAPVAGATAERRASFSPPFGYFMGRSHPPMALQPPQGPQGAVAAGGPHVGFWPMPVRAPREDVQQQVAQVAKQSAPVAGATVGGGESVVFADANAASHTREVKDDDAIIVEGDNAKNGSQIVIPEDVTSSDNRNVTGTGDTRDAVPENVTSGGNQNAAGPVPEDVASGGSPNVAGGNPEVARSNPDVEQSVSVAGATVGARASFYPPFGRPMGRSYPPMALQPPQGRQKADDSNDLQQQVAQGVEQSAPATVWGGASLVSKGIASSNPNDASHTRKVQDDHAMIVKGDASQQDAVPENVSSSDNQNVAGKGNTKNGNVSSGGNENVAGPAVPKDVARGDNPNVTGGNPNVAVGKSEAAGYDDSGEQREYDFLQVFF